MYPTDPEQAQEFTIDEAACAWVMSCLPSSFLKVWHGPDDPDERFADHVNYLPEHLRDQALSVRFTLKNRASAEKLLVKNRVFDKKGRLDCSKTVVERWVLVRLAKERKENPYFLWRDLNQAGGRSPAERPHQRHREAARAAADVLWRKDKTITIADMILCDEITKACGGKNYVEGTLRDWIKDLCPDRKPGRRAVQQG